MRCDESGSCQFFVQITILPLLKQCIYLERHGEDKIIKGSIVILINIAFAVWVIFQKKKVKEVGRG